MTTKKFDGERRGHWRTTTAGQSIVRLMRNRSVITTSEVGS